MKQTIIILFVAILFAGCNQVQEQNQEVPSDSIIAINEDKDFILDVLMNYRNMNELVKKFGRENVIIDTLWGPEGMFEIGTKLFPGTKNEVEFMWSDTLNYTDLFNIQTYAGYDENYNPVFESDWKTKDGLYIGMPLEELVKINGKPVIFLGFDWDYGGGIVSFEKGKLDNINLSIGLTYSREPEVTSDSDFSNIIGDVEISSDRKNLSKFKIKIVRMGKFRK